MENVERIHQIIDALKRAKLTSPATKKLLAELKELVPEREALAAFLPRLPRIPGPTVPNLPGWMGIAVGVVTAAAASYSAYKLYEVIDAHYNKEEVWK